MNGQNGLLDARVVLLTNFVPPYRLPLYEALAKRLGSLTILVSAQSETNRNWRFDSGALDVHVQRTTTVRRPWRHPAGFSDELSIHVPWDTLGWLRRLRPDVVVSAELGPRSLASAVYCLGRRSPPLILWATLSERTERGRGPLRRAVRRWLLHRADRIIVNGASGERYVRGFGVSGARIDRVPYSALPAFADTRREARRASGVERMLFVGQLSERKGVLPFVDALNNWIRSHDRRIVLTLVGSGPVRRKIEQYASHERLTIELFGEQEPGQLPAFFADADIFVFPTLADEWGVVVNEALAAGLPILGSRHSQAVEELCDDEKTGWLFDPEDDASVASAIDRALTSTGSELEAMSDAARARVRDLTPDGVAGQLLSSIRSALTSRD
jgi:glycosyltransferase involved in cell wall biosynthesis